MPLDIGSIAQDSVPENYYRIVADRLKDGLKNQVGPKGGWDGPASWASLFEVSCEAYHSQPIQQAKYRFTEITKRNGVFSPEEPLHHVKTGAWVNWPSLWSQC